MRLDEDFARETFERFLKARCHGGTLWSTGGEPPDYDLEVDHVSYAVEITQIMGSIELAGQHISARATIESLRRFVSAVEWRAVDLGILTGGYHLHVCPVPNLRQVAEELTSRILTYVAATTSGRATEPKVLWRGRRGQSWRLARVSEERQYIAPTFSVSGVKRQGDINADLGRIISTTLTSKARKLAGITRPVIVLLIDAYHFGDEDNWMAAVRDATWEPFHTVVRVFGEYGCQVLFSRADRWSTAA